MNTKNKYCGVLLFDEAYVHLDEALKPYIQTGPIGKYLYCTIAEQVGSFLNMTITPELVGNRIKNVMEISIPTHFVKFVASSPEKSSIGFGE